MIFLFFKLQNPFYREKSSGIHHFCDWHGKIIGHKYWEIETLKGNMFNLFSINLDLVWRGQDHAGFRFQLELFGYEILAQIYDNRHWNYEKGTWEKYD